MRPVNLLPEEHRPRRPGGGRPGLAYWALGGLAVALLAVLAVAVTSNQVSSKKAQIASLDRQTADLTEKAGALGPVSDFVAIKQSREQSVRDLAGRRFDWERMTRELARVIPSGAYVTDVSASTDGQGASGSSPAAATPASASGAAAGPSLSVSGCARSQPQVAALLVRLKRLNLAQDAVLEESARAGAADGTGSATTGTATSTATTGTQAACTRYSFKATVTFDPAALQAPPVNGGGKVPASLGGGS